jgi:hypothetical protein
MDSLPGRQKKVLGFVLNRKKHYINVNFYRNNGAFERPTDTKGEKSNVFSNFEFVGTSDNFSFLTASDAMMWRQKVCGGEQAIREYCTQLCRRGGQRFAEILGTIDFENHGGNFADLCMVNVHLPLQKPTEGEESALKGQDGDVTTVTEWMQQSMIKHYKTFMPVLRFQGSWWVLLSAQIYLEDDGFEWAGWTLKKLCHNLQLRED